MYEAITIQVELQIKKEKQYKYKWGGWEYPIAGSDGEL